MAQWLFPNDSEDYIIPDTLQHKYVVDTRGNTSFMLLGGDMFIEKISWELSYQQPVPMPTNRKTFTFSRIASRMALYCVETTDKTSIEIRLNSSKHPQAPV